MIGKRLDIKQSAHLISLAQTLCETDFALLHYLEELASATACPCQLTLSQQQPLEIFDLTADSRFKQSNFLRQNPNLNYYFGLSLITSTGEKLGTLCVYKKQNQGLTSVQKSAFKKIAALFSDLIEATFSKKRYLEQLSERDKKLVQLFEQAKEPLMTLEPPNWCFSSGNPAALDLFKVKTEQEFTQLGPWAVSPELQPDGSRSEHKAKEVVMKALKEGSYSFQWTHQTIDGKQFPSSVFLNRIVEGKRQYLQATVKDTSEQKQLRDNLKNQLAINEGIFNSTSEGILLVDHQSRKIQSYNARFLQMWQIPQALIDTHDDSKLIEHVLEQLVSPKLFVEIVEKLYQNPLEESQDTLLFNDDRVVERYSTPYICDGNIKGRVWFFRDVTEIKSMEKMVNQTSRLAAIGQLAAGIGHEINNPLTIIKGYLAKIMREGSQAPADVIESLKSVHSATDRIENIVTGLRSFAKIEKSALSDSFNLSSLFFEIENMLKGMYLSDGVQLEFDYSKLAEDGAIKGDRGKFEQVLINLIANAKDSTEGMDYRLVRVVVNNNAKQALVSISDNGSGISDVVKDKIFDPFFTTKDVGKGTGIGLSLVYRFITDEFNGAIQVKKSKLGDGSCFELSLPLSSQHHQGLDQETTTQVEITSPANYKLKVIIAEDEEHIRELLSDVLEMAGIEVFCCENGALALQEYKKNSAHYDLVISDMKMPLMDGLTLLKEIRAQVDLKQPKFFFTTGGINVDFENNQSELFKTIDGYFYKPFDLQDVHAQLAKSFPHAFS